MIIRGMQKINILNFKLLSPLFLCAPLSVVIVVQFNFTTRAQTRTNDRLDFIHLSSISHLLSLPPIPYLFRVNPC